MASPDLFRAGAAALEYNAPLSPQRADAIVEFVASCSPSTVVDLGCGDGALLLKIIADSDGVRGVGVDTASDSISAARDAANAAGLAERIEFIEGDATTWSRPADVAVCIGASHAWDSPSEMFAAIAELGAGAAVIGDGIWQAEPDSWCIDTFGDQPTVKGLEDMATAAGWRVEASTTSTPEEWDHFENTWVDGVRAVATPEAIEFADERAAEYQIYRGVLGFSWLHLRR